jgi:hypothetical protein
MATGTGSRDEQMVVDTTFEGSIWLSQQEFWARRLWFRLTGGKEDGSKVILWTARDIRNVRNMDAGSRLRTLFLLKQPSF